MTAASLVAQRLDGIDAGGAAGRHPGGQERDERERGGHRGERCRSRTALAQLKMIVLAPMPRASERTAATVTPGLRRSIRIPKRRS